MMKPEGASPDRVPGTILIVDDEPANITLLRGFLEPEGYRVVSASGGQEALEKAFRDSPDLVLLDVIMPGVGGFAVCRALKADPRSQFVPVVFTTALHDRQNRVAGLESGADDFLSKPLDDIEMLARCRNLIRIKRLTDDLRASYASLQALEKLQSDLTGMIVHDIRNAMTVIAGNISLAREDRGPTDNHLGLLQTAQETCRELLSMTDDLLELSRLESAEVPFKPQRVDVGKLLREQVKRLKAPFLSKRLTCEVETGERPVVVEADPSLLSRVLGNLLGNAVRYSPAEGKIWLVARADTETATALVSVFNDGEPIAPEHHADVFNKFKRLRPAEESGPRGLGLGLAFCKMAVEKHGGRIWVESPAAEGMNVCFRFTLPLRSGKS